jgi:hypothetical protein
MSTIIEVAERFRKLSQNIEKQISTIIDDTKEEIVKKNRQQLLDGIKSDGTEITPSYLNDPYFKTKEAAQRYSNWKDKITPSNKRKSGTPNLYINGFYHNSIKLDVKGEIFKIQSTASIGNDIERKYGENVYGLTTESTKAYISETFYPLFKQYIENTTQLKLE